jgi:hypothetical protein
VDQEAGEESEKSLMAHTEEELQQYIYHYKLDHQREANADMDKLFEKSNQLEQKLSSDLVVFASVMLTVMGGIIAAADLSLSHVIKIILAIGVVSLLLSILAGLASYRSMASFWKVWALAKQHRGGMIERDKSKTYKDLEKLRKAMSDYETKLPESSPKLFSRIQTGCFAVGVIVVALAIIGILFDFGNRI